MTIDWWTLGLEAINVAVLVWLLQRFFWNPVSTMLDERRVVAARDLIDAAAKRADADKALAALNAERAGLQQEREAVLAKAAVEADDERVRRLERATEEIAALRAQSEASVAKEKADVHKALQYQAAALAVDIAARLLARIDTASIEAGFLDGLRKQIASLPPWQRQALAGQPLKFISASALTEDEQSDCRRMLDGALGSASDLAFETDPKLIAGFVLDTPNVVIGNSWRDDLDRIRSELTHE
ncbi:MAG: F0F1 ATP synthase subunit delta [Proteobacteria bacterium]|nr:F0F1 ATP synthase subunit delta [Pseudomonadota bacterium]